MLRRLGTAASILIIVIFVVVVAAIWIVARGVQAASHLADEREDVARIQTDLINGTNPANDLREAKSDAAAANGETHDPVWFALSWIPPIHTVRGLTSASNELVQNALPSVVSVGTTLEPAKLRIARNVIALAPLRRAAPALGSAATAVAKARDQVAGLSGGWGLLGDVRQKALTELTSLAGSVSDAARFARAGPAMLGEHGEQTYFVAIQNNAEARATGGLVAAYAIITADHGRLRVVQRGNDSQLQDFIVSRRSPVVTLDKDYEDTYGTYSPTSRWITSNVSPNFPDAATIWAHMWQAQTGEHVAGVFGVDPYALQAMLGATGSVTVPGYAGTYTGTNLAKYIESREYFDFPGTTQADVNARKDFVSAVAHVVLKKLLSGSGDPSAIVTALGHSAGGGHLQLWSANPTEQAQISGTPLAGELPATTSPFAAVHIDNATGAKLDYYLDRSLTYTAGSCSGDYRDSTITVTLNNAAPKHGLPPYVRVKRDRDFGSPGSIEKVPRNKMFVFIHATAGAALLRATVDGHLIQVSPTVEQGHAVFSFPLTLNPEVPRTIQLNLSEPTAAGAAATQVQPMARPQQTHISVPTCG